MPFSWKFAASALVRCEPPSRTPQHIVSATNQIAKVSLRRTCTNTLTPRLLRRCAFQPHLVRPCHQINSVHPAHATFGGGQDSRRASWPGRLGSQACRTGNEVQESDVWKVVTAARHPERQHQVREDTHRLCLRGHELRRHQSLIAGFELVPQSPLRHFLAISIRARVKRGEPVRVEGVLNGTRSDSVLGPLAPRGIMPHG